MQMVKGSAEAKAWAKKMQAARKKRRGTPKDNPSRIYSGTIKGVIYNRIIEIRAEKTVYKPGLYKHPFHCEAQVLAMDNGDLLIRSVDGTPLWAEA